MDLAISALCRGNTKRCDHLWNFELTVEGLLNNQPGTFLQVVRGTTIKAHSQAKLYFDRQPGGVFKLAHCTESVWREDLDLYRGCDYVRQCMLRLFPKDIVNMIMGLTVWEQPPPTNPLLRILGHPIASIPFHDLSGILSALGAYDMIEHFHCHGLAPTGIETIRVRNDMATLKVMRPTLLTEASGDIRRFGKSVLNLSRLMACTNEELVKLHTEDEWLDAGQSVIFTSHADEDGFSGLNIYVTKVERYLSHIGRVYIPAIIPVIPSVHETQLLRQVSKWWMSPYNDALYTSYAVHTVEAAYWSMCKLSNLRSDKESYELQPIIAYFNPVMWAVTKFGEVVAPDGGKVFMTFSVTQHLMHLPSAWSKQAAVGCGNSSFLYQEVDKFSNAPFSGKERKYQGRAVDRYGLYPFGTPTGLDVCWCLFQKPTEEVALKSGFGDSFDLYSLDSSVLSCMFGKKLRLIDPSHAIFRPIQEGEGAALSNYWDPTMSIMVLVQLARQFEAAGYCQIIGELRRNIMFSVGEVDFKGASVKEHPDCSWVSEATRESVMEHAYWFLPTPTMFHANLATKDRKVMNVMGAKWRRMLKQIEVQHKHASDMIVGGLHAKLPHNGYFIPWNLIDHLGMPGTSVRSPQAQEAFLALGKAIIKLIPTTDLIFGNARHYWSEKTAWDIGNPESVIRELERRSKSLSLMVKQILREAEWGRDEFTFRGFSCLMRNLSDINQVEFVKALLLVLIYLGRPVCQQCLNIPYPPAKPCSKLSSDTKDGDDVSEVLRGSRKVIPYDPYNHREIFQNDACTMTMHLNNYAIQGVNYWSAETVLCCEVHAHNFEKYLPFRNLLGSNSKVVTTISPLYKNWRADDESYFVNCKLGDACCSAQDILRTYPRSYNFTKAGELVDPETDDMDEDKEELKHNKDVCHYANQTLYEAHLALSHLSVGTAPNPRGSKVHLLVGTDSYAKSPLHTEVHCNWTTTAVLEFKNRFPSAYALLIHAASMLMD